MKKLTRRSFTAAGILSAMGVAASFVPSCNEAEGVYGPPPEYYEATNNEPVTVYGPPEDFDPSGNELVDVYGPPVAFESHTFDSANNELAGVYGPPPGA